MSLYGALFSGVAGLNAQSTGLSILADNIANTNTVGYKGSNALFQSLVTGTSSNTSYSPGGVIGGAHQTVDQQGLLQSTSSPTDIAIQGSGLFVVNQTSDGTGQVLFTRAGSFVQDSLGNFKNSAGFFLQAWPLDRSGNLPGAPGNTNTTSSANLSSLETVNIQNVTGTAAPTSTVSLSANLDAGAPAYPGASVTAAMDPEYLSDFGVAAKDIIVPGGADSLTAGDAFGISTGSGLSYTYTYGGFTYSRDVTSSSSVGGSGAGLPLATQATLGITSASVVPAQVTAAPVTTSATPSPTSLNIADLVVSSVTDGDNTTYSKDTIVVSASTAGLHNGDYVNVSGADPAGFDGIPQGDMNGSHQITVIDANTFTFTVATPGSSGGQTDSDALTITPAPFATGVSGGQVVVSAPTTGLHAGDWVTIHGASTNLDGVSVNGTYQITALGTPADSSDTHHFIVDVPTMPAPGTPVAQTSTTAVTVTPAVFTTVANLDSHLVIAGTPPTGSVAGSTYVTLSGNVPATVNNVPTNGTFKITSIGVDGNGNPTYTVDTGTNANAAGGGNASQSLQPGTVTATIAPFTTNSGTNTTYLNIADAPPAGAVVGSWVTLGGTGGLANTPANVNSVPTNGTFQIKSITTDGSGNPIAYSVDTSATATAGGGDVTQTTASGTVTARLAPFTTNAATTSTLNINEPPPTGVIANDYVVLSGNVPAMLNGVPTNGTFKVVSVSTNSYVVNTVTGDSTQAGGGGTTDLTPTTSVNATVAPFAVSDESHTVTVFQPNHGMVSGAVVDLSGNSQTIGGIPATDFQGRFVVTVVDDNHYQITVADQATSDAGGGTGTITASMRPFVGNILDATTPTESFLATTGTSNFTTAALSFSITTAAAGTATFTYTPSAPNTQLGQFNNLTNLASAINNINGLSARVVNNQLYVAATDSSDAVTFANGSTTGVSGPPVQAGIDWVDELGLANIASGNNRFATLQGLSDLINNSSGLTATINNPLGTASLGITLDDPLGTMTVADRAIAAPLAGFTNANLFTTTSGSKVVTITPPTTFNPPLQNGDIIHLDSTGMTGTINGIPVADFNGDFTVSNVVNNTFTITVADAAGSPGGASGPSSGQSLIVTPPNNTGSVISALGIQPSLLGLGFTQQTTGTLGPAYAPTVSATNMASGAITPQFSRPITIYDGLGTAHNLDLGFIKTGNNTWAVEVFAQPATDVNSIYPDGIIAYGNVTFNGDGSLRSISSSLTQPLSINWTNGATPSSLAINWGTAGQPFGTPNASAIGKTDGLSQFDSDYKVNFANQNGAPVGDLTGVSIDEHGYIIASYSNGETQKLYKIPLANFTSPDQLDALSGNVFAQSSGSGQVALTQAGTNGVGNISSSTLEASNVELANQLTDMIVAQRSYQANTKVISTADQLLSDLDQILQ